MQGVALFEIGVTVVHESKGNQHDIFLAFEFLCHGLRQIHDTLVGSVFKFTRQESGAILLHHGSYFLLVAPVQGIHQINGDIRVVTTDIVHHPGDGVHGISRVIFQAVGSQENLNSVRINARGQLVIFPVEHLLNRIVKGLDSFVIAIGIELGGLQVILGRKAAPSLMAVPRPASCARKSELVP